MWNLGVGGLGLLRFHPTRLREERIGLSGLAAGTYSPSIEVLEAKC